MKKSPRPLPTTNFSKFYAQYNTPSFNENKKLSKRSKALWKQKIETAMSLGQHTIVLCVFWERDRVYEHEYSDVLCDKRSFIVHHAHTREPLYKSPKKKKKSIVIWLQRAYAHVVKTVEQWGLHIQFCSLMTRPESVLWECEPVMANFIQLRAIVMPEDPCLRDRPGCMLELWNNVHSQRCIGTELVPHWTHRIRSAIACGVSFCVLVTLHADGFERCLSETEAEKRGYMRCHNPRNHLTLKVLPKSKLLDPAPFGIVVDNRYKAMVEWTRKHLWNWTLLFGTALSSDRKKIITSTWCYFTILLDPLSMNTFV